MKCCDFTTLGAESRTMSTDTIAIIAASIFCALAGSAATAITLVSSVRTDVAWLKTRLVDISNQLDHLDRRQRQ